MKRFFLIALLFTHGSGIYCRQSECDSFLSCVLKTEDCNDNCSFGKTFFSPRPQDSNSALRLINIAHEDHTTYYDYDYDYDSYDDPFAWGFDISVGAQQTFSERNTILDTWFLFNGCSSITVGIPSDELSFDVDGRQLGLNTNDGSAGQIGTLSLHPSIKNIVTNLTAWFDLNCILKGLWLRTNCAIVRTKRSLSMCSFSENIAESGSFSAGAYSIDCSETVIPYHSIIDAFIGDQAIGAVPALQYGKFYCGSVSETALASIRCDLGCDCIKSTTGFLNVSACIIAPTGNRPKGRYLFEPVVGANKSWQLGATISGAYTGHQFADERGRIDFYADATLTHLFNAEQTRLFALKNNGSGSQYMLLKTFDFDVGAVLAGERTANVLSGSAHIGAHVMVDASLMMHMQYKRFFFDLGYNFWLRSHETLSRKVCLRNFTKDTYGIKGDTSLSKIDVDSGFCIGNLITESKATIGQPAAADTDTVFLDVCDIDFNAPLHPLALSNKLFGALGYSKDKRFYCVLEGEVEFGHRALDQWAVSITIGTSL